MANRWIHTIVGATILSLSASYAFSDYTVTQGSGSTVFAFVCFTTKICPAHVLTNSAGTEIMTAGNPGQVNVLGTVPLPTGAATATNQTGGAQKSQIVDGSGNVIAATSNALNVNVANANANGQATMANSSPVVIASNQTSVSVINGASGYETIAASQTAQILGGSGATGDYLSHCVVYPTSTSPGVVTVFDNTNAAGTNVITFPGGTTSLSNLAPIAIPVGAISGAGPWKVTTGANVIVTCYGRFT